jgi:hypothetical protein
MNTMIYLYCVVVVVSELQLLATLNTPFVEKNTEMTVQCTSSADSIVLGKHMQTTLFVSATQSIQHG